MIHPRLLPEVADLDGASQFQPEVPPDLDGLTLVEAVGQVDDRLVRLKQGHLTVEFQSDE